MGQARLDRRDEKMTGEYVHREKQEKEEEQRQGGE
jgi:hypothetical protein